MHPTLDEMHAEEERRGIREWGRIRERGRWRYIWTRGILLWAGLFSSGQLLGYWLSGRLSWPLVLFITSASLAGGCFFGAASWKSREKEFSDRQS